MSISFDVASLPPIQSRPSDDSNQWNFSNHSLGLVILDAFMNSSCWNFSSLVRSSLSFFFASFMAVWAPTIFLFCFFASSKYRPAFSSRDWVRSISINIVFCMMAGFL